MKILKELKNQIKDIQRGSTSELSLEFGHAIGMIAQVGQEEALCGEKPEVQIKKMRQKAEDEVIRLGPKILDFLRPELRALIQPEDMAQLEKEHQIYLLSGREHES